MAEERRSSGERPVFVTTSLDTRLAVAVSDDDTVGRLKQKVADEHLVCFPKIGGIKLTSMKVRRKSEVYHLSDLMLVKSAFDGLKGFWSLNVDADVISPLNEDTSMKLGRSKATDGNPDKSFPTLGQDQILGPHQSCSYPLELYPTCNVQDVSLDNLNTSLEKGDDIPDQHGKKLKESASQGKNEHSVYAENDAVEATLPNPDYSKDSKVRAEVVEIGIDFDGDNGTARKRGRAVKRGDNEIGASQKRQRKKASRDIAHANLPLENQISTNLPNSNLLKPLKESSAATLSTNRLPEEMAPGGTGINKDRRKRKSSPENKADPGLLSETNNQTLKGNLEMNLVSQVGISEDSVQSSERALVQNKLDNLIDSLLESSDKDFGCKGENAANSLLELSESLEGDVSTKELVPKAGGTTGTVSGEPRIKEFRMSNESTIKEKKTVQTKSRIASAKKVVNKNVILEAKNEEKCHGKGNDGNKNVKIVDEQTKGSVPLAASDDVLKNIESRNGPVETSESVEIRMDKFEEVPRSKRRSLENCEGKVVENGKTKLFVDGAPEVEFQYKEPQNVGNLIQINGKKSRSNLINSSKMFDEGTQGEMTPHAHQTQVQNEHEDLNVLENSKSLENAAQIKKKKSSKSRKSLPRTDLNQKSEHDKSLEAEACHQRGQDGEAIVNEASRKQQNSRDELIVPVKQIEENAGKEKHPDQTGEVKSRDGNSAYGILEHHEDAASEALSNKCRTKSKAKKTARAIKDAVNQNLDNVENHENIHSTNLRVDYGLALEKQTDTVKIMAHHFTNDEKEVKRKSKRTEALVTEDIDGGLLSPMGRNDSLLDMKDGLVKKPNRKPNKAKGDLTLVDSGMTSEKNSCPRPDVANQTDLLGYNDKESLSGKIDKSPLLDILLPKAAEPESGPAMKESHERALAKQNADDQLENFGSQPSKNFPAKEPIQQSKRPSKKTPATDGRESYRTVANKQKPSRAKVCPIDDSSHNTENLEGTVYTSNQGASTPAHASPYLLAGRKPRDKGFGTVMNQSNRKKRALAESDSIFESTDSESSHDFRKGNKSDSDTKSPDESSGYSEDTPMSRKLPNVNASQTGSVRTVAHDGKRTIRGDHRLSQASSGRKSLDAVFRNSSSYKKAKVIASQSMLDPAESETI